MPRGQAGATDGETPALPVAGEWTVGHRAYRLPLPAFVALWDARSTGLWQKGPCHFH